MLKSTLIFSVLLSFIGFKTFSQVEDSTANAPKKPAKIEIKFKDPRLFNGVRFGIDVAGIVYPFIVNDERLEISNKYEINGDFGVKNFFLAMDLGTARVQRKHPGPIPTVSKYESVGSYLRIGADYRVSKSAKSFLFIGGRLGKAIFRETAEVTFLPRELNGLVLIEGTSKNIDRNLSANWFEATSGIKVYIWNNFYLGYTLRCKFLIPTKKIGEAKPLDIPGFGVNRNTNIGLSFHLMYRIPFGKDPEVPLKGR